MDIQQLLSQLEPWAKKIEEFDDVVKIYYVPNPDSMIATAILGRVFLDLEKPCILSPFPNNYQSSEDKLRKSAIFLGIKIEELTEIEKLDRFVVILDVDEYALIENVGDNIVDLTQWIEPPNAITIAAIVYFICNPIAKTLDYIVRLPLISHICTYGLTDFLGIAELICKDAIDGSVAIFQKKFIFLGSDIFSIPELLEYSQYPFLPGLSGNEVNVNSVLAKSGIEVIQGNKNRSINDLSKQEITELNSRLVLFMSTQKGHQEDEMTFIRNILVFQDEEKKGITSSVLDFSRSIIDSINRTQISLAIVVLMGNRGSKFLLLQKLFIEERKALSVSFQLLRDHSNEIEDLGALRIFTSDRKVSWYNTSITAGMALSNGLVKSDKPFAVIAPGPEDLVTIGFRASKAHKIGNGLESLLMTVILSTGNTVEVSGSKLSAIISVNKETHREILLNLNRKLVELVQ